MRLFIAIRFPANIEEALSGIMADLMRQGVCGNFSRKENLHLTLAFLGDVKSPDEVCRAMDRVNAAKMRLELDGGGSFGNLCWVGLKESPALNDYVKRLRAQLQKNGIWFDPSPVLILFDKAITVW